MESSTFSLIRFYLFILAGFFIWMYINKKNWYQNRLMYHGTTVFVPIFMFTLLMLFQGGAPAIELPKIDMPQMPAFQMPQMPGFQMPAFQLPGIQMPAMQMPTMQLPKM